jgi:hypothetical protein
MLSWIRRAFARLWRPRRRATEHDFYDQHEASRYRTMHESRQDGDLPSDGWERLLPARGVAS